MKEQLAALGLAVEERPVADLWPRRLLRERAGHPPPSVVVARPDSYEQVVELLRWAAAAGARVVPMGAASAVTGVLAPARGDVVLDLRGFDRVLDVDAVNLTLTVQAGAVAMDVERRLAVDGLTLGHQPSSLPVSTIGGLVSTASSGQESSRYGNIEDMLLGVTAVLADGTLLRPRPGPRSAVGPPLHHLLVGAEGGLAVILDVRLRVHRLPAAVVGRGFLFDAIEPGLGAMRGIMQAGLRPVVMRLYDTEDTALQGVTEGGCLFVCAVAGEPAVAAAEAEVVARLAAAGRDLGEAPWERWLAHRYDLSTERLLEFMKPPGAFVDTIEVAAPWSHLAAVHAAVKAALAERALALCHFSHAYEQGACAYFTFAGTAPSEAEAEAVYDACWAGAMTAARAEGATISHHHGVGQVRGAWAREEMGEWWRVWEAVRGALDRASTLNPNALGGAS